MRRLRYVPVLVVMLMGFGAQGAAAQFGPILDWITKMSGPGMVRVGVQYTAHIGGGDRALEVSAAGMYGFRVRDGDGPDGDADLNMWSLQTTLGVPIFLISPDVAILGVAGVATHAFRGDGFDNFTAFSIPLQGALRIRTAGAVTFRIGGGVNLMRFPDDAFAPLNVGVDAGDWEIAPGAQISVEFDL